MLLPGASLPLHIFEPRYRQLTVDLVTGAVPDKQFGVVAVREGWSPDDDDIAGLHSVGCTAELRDVRRLPDGRFDIVTRGCRRFRLLDLDAEAQPVPDGGRSSTCPTPPDEPEPDDIAGPRRRGPRRPPPLLHHGLEERRLVRAGRRRRARRRCRTCSPPTACSRWRTASACWSRPRPRDRLRMVRALLIREAGLLGAAARRPRPLHTFAVDLHPN